MEIDIKQFKTLEKQSADSFHKQKNTIKKVLAGKIVNCLVCKKPLAFQDNLKQKNQPAQLKCAKGCTDIELDIEL
jgi:hypothetical protein